MKKKCTFLYDLILFLAGICLLPWVLYQIVFKGKYRKNFWKRLGFGFPSIRKGGRPLVWIHAVSMGEAKAISGLAELLKKELNNPILIISSVTETGHAEARKSMSFADDFVYLPFDFKWIIKPIIQKVKPDFVLLCETDFWFNFLAEARNVGAFIAVVNGKLSEKSLTRYQMIGRFPLFEQLDLVCVQNETYQKRFSKLGISPEKIKVTGNLKCGVVPAKLNETEKEEWQKKFGLKPDHLVLTLGSTHNPEEKKLLTSLKPLLSKFENLKILIVPRHPERFDSVAELLKQLNLPFGRYSNASIQSSQRVALIDAMGVLLKCYQLSDVALVAGSFTEKVGGHNILEPAFFGVPVLFGPHMHSQTDFASLTKENGSGIQVNEENVAQVVSDLLENREKRIHLGAKGRQLTSELQGAKEKTWMALEPYLKAFRRNS